MLGKEENPERGKLEYNNKELYIQRGFKCDVTGYGVKLNVSGIYTGGVHITGQYRKTQTAKQPQ